MLFKYELREILDFAEKGVIQLILEMIKEYVIDIYLAHFSFNNQYWWDSEHANPKTWFFDILNIWTKEVQESGRSRW